MTGNMAIALVPLAVLFVGFLVGVLVAKTGVDAESIAAVVIGVSMAVICAAAIYAVITLTHVADGREAWRLTENPDGSRSWRMVETRKDGAQ